MSIYSFPRLNFKGLLIINVGTANNDDYSGSDYDGKPLRLADSIMVQPIDFGMDDATFISWAQKSQPVTAAPAQDTRRTFLNKGNGRTAQQQYLIPSEWNYYGDMGLTMQDMKLVSVQTGPGSFDPNSPYIGAQLSFNNRPGSTGGSTGMLIDVNPEGVPSSQVFADCLTLTGTDGTTAIFSAKPSKAATRWINFQRNARLRGPNGAAAYFQCVVPASELQGQPILKLMSQPGSPPLGGIVFRYYMFRSLQPINTFKYPDDEWRAKIEAIYQNGQNGKDYSTCINPTYCQLSGTIAPWYESEMQSVTTGRYFAPTQNTVPVPPPPPGESGGNGNAFSLAPAVFQVSSNAQTVSIDFVGTFPDQYQKTTQNPYDPLQTDNNPKMDFGPVTLNLRLNGQDKVIQQISYADTAQGDKQGWIFDVPLTGFSPQQIQEGTFVLNSSKYGDLLIEQDFFIASDQSCIYGEQYGSETLFTNESATDEMATIRMFRKGQEVSPQTSPPIAVWQYAQVPNQDQNNFKPVKLMSNYKPGTPLRVHTQLPGVFLFIFLPESVTPPADAADVDLMNTPLINLRILPNNKDYGQYYQNPSSPEPIGNDKLTFNVIFLEVLRNYYLLYPAMNLVIPLNDPEQWDDAEMARRLYAHTQKSWFDQYGYMPRTRDLSQTRRTLLHAWAR